MTVGGTYAPSPREACQEAISAHMFGNQRLCADLISEACDDHGEEFVNCLFSFLDFHLIHWIEENPETLESSRNVADVVLHLIRDLLTQSAAGRQQAIDVAARPYLMAEPDPQMDVSDPDFEGLVRRVRLAQTVLASRLLADDDSVAQLMDQQAGPEDWREVVIGCRTLLGLVVNGERGQLAEAWLAEWCLGPIRGILNWHAEASGVSAEKQMAAYWQAFSTV